MRTNCKPTILHKTAYGICEKACGENDLTFVIQGIGFSTMTMHLIILLCLYVNW